MISAAGGSRGGRETADKLRNRKLELADQNAARRGHRKADAVRTGRQRQSQVGDQQRFAHLGFAAHKQNPLRR
jgi:hypothetical protein